MPEAGPFPQTTENALAAHKAHPDRIIPFCCVDPRTSFTGGRKALPGMLKRYVDQGAKGFGKGKDLP